MPTRFRTVATPYQLVATDEKCVVLGEAPQLSELERFRHVDDNNIQIAMVFVGGKKQYQAVKFLADYMLLEDFGSYMLARKRISFYQKELPTATIMLLILKEAIKELIEISRVGRGRLSVKKSESARGEQSQTDKTRGWLANVARPAEGTVVKQICVNPKCQKPFQYVYKGILRFKCPDCRKRLSRTVKKVGARGPATDKNQEILPRQDKVISWGMLGEMSAEELAKALGDILELKKEYPGYYAGNFRRYTN